MCRVIEDYIYHRKEVKVKVIPRPHEVPKLIMAYNYAINWFNKHKVN